MDRGHEVRPGVGITRISLTGTTDASKKVTVNFGIERAGAVATQSIQNARPKTMITPKAVTMNFSPREYL